MKTTYLEFLNENKNIGIELYHGGTIEGDIKSPIHLTPDYYMAKSYGDVVYTFYLDSNSKILDLTSKKTFVEIKRMVYDKYSEKYLKYKVYGGFGLETKERIQKNYEVLKKYKDFDDIKNRYNQLINIDYINDIWFDDNHRKDINRISIFYKNATIEQKKVIDELEILEHEVKNIDRLDDYGLNTFGVYFQDYCKLNNYDGYKAISTYLDGRTKGIEYCILNIEKINKAS